MTVIRRIDDLGRIVIPKEMREAMRINAGEAFDVTNTQEGKIIIEKINTVSFDDEVTINIPKDRKMYNIRCDVCAGNVVLLTEDQIKFLNWLLDNEYLRDGIYYDEYTDKNIEII